MYANAVEPNSRSLNKCLRKVNVVVPNSQKMFQPFSAFHILPRKKLTVKVCTSTTSCDTGKSFRVVGNCVWPSAVSVLLQLQILTICPLASTANNMTTLLSSLSKKITDFGLGRRILCPMTDRPWKTKEHNRLPFFFPNIFAITHLGCFKNNISKLLFYSSLKTAHLHLFFSG